MMTANALHRVSTALLLCLGAWATHAYGGEVPVGQALPDITLHGINGPQRTLAAFRGRPLIINVWASWCGPCRQEMASLERLAWRDEGRAFAIIGISTDDDPGQALAFLTGAHATISQFLDSHQELESLLGASRIPLTILVDARGRILKRVYGSRQWDSPQIRQLLDNTFGVHKLRQTSAPIVPEHEGRVQGLLR